MQHPASPQPDLCKNDCKDKRKAGRKTLLYSFIFAPAIAFLCLAVSLFGVMHADFLYRYRYTTGDVAQSTGASLEALMALTDDIQRYLDGEILSFDLTLNRNGTDTHVFTAREILHMQDVQALFSSIKMLGIWGGILASALALSLWHKDKETLAKALKKAVLWILLFYGVLCALMLIDFQNAFLLMHNVLFRNDLWLLGSDDMLIMLFDENFFMMMGFCIVALNGLLLCSIALLSRRFLNKLRRLSS